MKGQRQRSKRKQRQRQQAGKKKTEDDEWLTQIECDIQDKTFNALSTFHCKDDCITLAGTLGISHDGTVEELKTCIKDYLANPANANSTENPHFTALFHAKGKGHALAALPPNLTDQQGFRAQHLHCLHQPVQHICSICIHHAHTIHTHTAHTILWISCHYTLLMINLHIP